jgi:hypothetical protein
MKEPSTKVIIFRCGIWRYQISSNGLFNNPLEPIKSGIVAKKAFYFLPEMSTT